MIIVGCRKINKKIPGALIAVIGAIVVSYLVNLAAYGVAVLGTVPGGLPKIGLPTGATLNPSIFEQLLAGGFLDIHRHPGAERGHLTGLCHPLQ